MESGASSYHRFQNGDQTGLVDLVRLYRDSLLLFINGYVKNMAAAEDILEDVFADLIVKQRRLKDDGAIRAYLFQCGRNRALNVLKRQGRYPQIAIQDVEYELAEEETLEHMVFQQEQRRQLHRAMGELHPQYRETLYLLYFEEMSYEAAGTVLKKSSRQIKDLAYRARKSLRAILEREGFQYEDI